MKGRFASVIFVVLVLLPVSLALCVLAARADSRREVVLHSFNGTDGGVPTTGMIQGRDGNFYGTTNQGGANGVGTVFRLTPSGILTTMYSFCSQANCADGESPFGGVIQGSDGNFYGT